MKLEIDVIIADDEDSLMLLIRRLGMPQNMKAFIAAAAISFGLAAPISHAQSTQAAPAASPEVIQPSPKQLDQYAEVAQQVAMVAADYQPKLENAKDDATRQKLMREADDKMVSSVKSGGLSVEEYNGISMAIQQDQALQQQIQQRIQSQ